MLQSTGKGREEVAPQERVLVIFLFLHPSLLLCGKEAGVLFTHHSGGL